MSLDYEQLGLLYLGGHVDNDGTPPASRPTLVESKHLTTHAVIVGMTGSGKTGLGAVLLEEAAIDGIPAIVIDPKGDLGNLLLTFPGLDPAAIAPWVPQDDSADAVASRMRAGLAEWRQDPARVGAFEGAVERAIYTPGSKAGRGLSILQGFDAPGDDDSIDADEARRARAVALTSSLLSLAGIEGDPVQSPEHVLVSSVLLHLWQQNPHLDLGALLANIQNPPFAKLGLMAVDTVVPPADRQQIAMRLNTALSSPALQGFLEGEPLDVERLLYTAEGKPRLAIITLAHLSDELRMFFITLLLNEVLAWTRRQPGTTSLRALLYMDEVAGYLPPVKMPPSKAPIMTLLKQARAFGVGCVLATQNPVDVDYKALSNAGIWFLGRLQTERDKARVLEGLEGNASATGSAFNKATVDAALSSLPKRSFYLHNVHAKAPQVFQTRFALSYLRGPLTPTELVRLRTSGAPVPTPAPASKPAPLRTPSNASSSNASSPPPLPAGVPVRFVGAGGEHHPYLWAKTTVQYKHAKSGVDIWQTRHLLVPFVDDVPAFDTVAEASDEASWTAAPPSSSSSSSSFAPLPPLAARDKTWVAWTKNVAAAVVADLPLVLQTSPATGVVSKPGEARGPFIQRVAQRARELRDLEVEKLKKSWDAKIVKAQTALDRAEQKAATLGQRRSAQTMGATVDVGISVLGALFGFRRSVATAAGKAAKSASRVMASGEGIDAANAAVDAAQAALTQLQTDAEAAFEGVHERIVKGAAVLEELRIPAKKVDVTVETCGLLWVSDSEAPPT